MWLGLPCASPTSDLRRLAWSMRHRPRRGSLALRSSRGQRGDGAHMRRWADGDYPRRVQFLNCRLGMAGRSRGDPRRGFGLARVWSSEIHGATLRASTIRTHARSAPRESLARKSLAQLLRRASPCVALGRREGREIRGAVGKNGCSGRCGGMGIAFGEIRSLGAVRVRREEVILVRRTETDLRELRVRSSAETEASGGACRVRPDGRAA